MEHLIAKIADIAKEKKCPIFLGITPDNKIIISVFIKRRIMRKVEADQSEENIIDTIKDVIRTAREE